MVRFSFTGASLLLLNAALLLYIAQSLFLRGAWFAQNSPSYAAIRSNDDIDTGRHTGPQLEAGADVDGEVGGKKRVRGSGYETTRALDESERKRASASPSPRSAAERARDGILAGKDAKEAALGAADTDGRTCDASEKPFFNASLAWNAMADNLPTAYEDTTYCEDWGRTCLQGDELVLFDDRFQVKDGFWRRVDNEVTKKMKRLMFWVAWGGGNPDIYVNNLKRYDTSEGFFKAWPAGADATPPVSFSTCNTPLLLFWEFPENFYHTMVMWSAVWAAVRSGALDSRLSLALVTAHAGAPYTLATPDYISVPASMMFRRSVTTFSHFSQHGQGRAHPGREDARVAFPPTRCFDRLPLCLATSYSERPPLHFYEFMQAVKDELLGLPRNFDATAPSLVPYAWPDGVTHVSGPTGAIRVTLAIRESNNLAPPIPGGRVHTRRVLNFPELQANCSLAGTTVTIAGQKVPIVCTAYAFGQDGGMHGDVRQMQATDVLVAVHGAGLTNLGFLRPGATILEIRPGGFDAANADRFYRPFARSSKVLKWWGVRLNGALQQRGWFEARHMGNPEKYGRDRDLVVPWPKLVSALEAVLPLPYAKWAEAEAGNRVFTDASA